MVCVCCYNYIDRNHIKKDIQIFPTISATKSLSSKNTVEPVYSGHLGTKQKRPDYIGVLIFQVSLYNKESFGTITKCVDYAGVPIFKCPD